ncbi:hypothetical protein Q9R34_17565 [Enterobacter sp. BRE11]|nr:hypothetical protein [Enterobacter sp. BRE11]
MRMTYDEIKNDSEVIALQFGLSKKEVPSFFSPLKRMGLHLLVYFLFSFFSYFLMPEGSDKLAWFCALAFGVVNWIFIIGFIFGYEFIFSVVNDPKVNELKLVKVLKRKVRAYGMVWLVSLVLLGGVSLVTEMNLGALVIGNFIISLIGLLLFNVDISRYQISGMLGVASALNQSFKK